VSWSRYTVEGYKNGRSTFTNMHYIRSGPAGTKAVAKVVRGEKTQAEELVALANWALGAREALVHIQVTTHDAGTREPVQRLAESLRATTTTPTGATCGRLTVTR
jgi:hypothetical protein